MFAFALQPQTPLQMGMEKGNQLLSEACQCVFSRLLVCPLCYLSFPFQFQLNMNPTCEHKKWVKSPIYGQTPFRRDFGWRWSTGLHMCKGERAYKRKRGWRHDWGRERKTFFFFTLVLNWFCRCCLVTTIPFEKHPFLLKISLKVYSHSVDTTLLLTIGQ